MDELCRWCNAPAKEQIVLEPERYRYITYAGERVKEMSKRAITAGVCGDCMKHMVLRKTEKPDTYTMKK